MSTVRSFGSYLKEAFLVKIPIPGMGAMPVNILGVAAFGILGFALPPLWLLGLGLEAAFLTTLAGNNRFQRLVDARDIDIVSNQWQNRHDELFNRLGKTSRAQYTALVNKVYLIRKEQGMEGDSRQSLKLPGLSQLVWTFLQLLINRQNIQNTVNSVSPEEIEKEIIQTRKKIEEVKNNQALIKSLQGRLDIAQKRLDNLAKASQNLELVEAEIIRMEHQVDLLLEEDALQNNPEALSARLDSVIHSIDTTSQWMMNNPDIDFTMNEPLLPESIPSIKQVKES